MTARADVYAGDIDRSGPDGGLVADYIFRIRADATPDVLSRIANPFLASNVAPRNATLRTPKEGLVEVEVVMPRIRPALAESICRKLDQLIIVTDVRYERAAAREFP